MYLMRIVLCVRPLGDPPDGLQQQGLQQAPGALCGALQLALLEVIAVKFIIAAVLQGAAAGVEGRGPCTYASSGNVS